MNSLARVLAALVLSAALLLTASACKSAGNVKEVPASVITASASVSFQPLSERCKVDTDRDDLAVRRGAAPRSMPVSCVHASPSAWRAFVVSDTAMLHKVYG